MKSIFVLSYKTWYQEFTVHQASILVVSLLFTGKGICVWTLKILSFEWQQAKKDKCPGAVCKTDWMISFQVDNLYLTPAFPVRFVHKLLWLSAVLSPVTVMNCTHFVLLQGSYFPRNYWYSTLSPQWNWDKKLLKMHFSFCTTSFLRIPDWIILCCGMLK